MYDLSSCDIFEGMTSISAIINSVIRNQNDRKIYKILFDKSKTNSKSHELHFLKKTALKLDFDIQFVNSEEIDSITSGATHGGIVAICSHRTFSALDAAYCSSRSFCALIEGVEDPYNFGYSVRSLYAAGVDGIILPPRNWMESSGTVARASAGTSELADICICDPFEAVKLFKNNGFEIVCAGIRDSVSIYEHDFSKPVLLVVGGEKRGISRKILDLSDTIVRIDYGRDFMGSLPTASAVSVIAFEILRQKRFLH